MWELFVILGIIIVIIIVLITFKVFKFAFKIFSVVVFVLFLISVVFSFFIYRDAMDFKENFAAKDNLFLLEKDGKLLAGLQLRLDEMATEPDGIVLLTQSEIDGYAESYASEEYDALLGERYKILFMDYEVFDYVETIDFEGDEISNEFLLSVLESDDPTKTYEEKFVLPGSSNTDLKSRLFALLLTQKNDDPLFLLMGIKQGRINVYPKTMLFKAVDYFPLDLMGDQLSNIIQSNDNGEEDA